MNHFMSKKKNRAQDVEQGRPLNGNGSVSAASDDAAAPLPLPATNDPNKQTDVLEVWFAGCHTGSHTSYLSISAYIENSADPPSRIDVGGGSVTDTTQYSLAQTTLQWMMKEIVAAGCGIILDDEALKRNNIDLAMPTPAPTPAPDTPPPQPSADALDAIQPIHDALKTTPIWWLLEIVPTQYAYQDAKGVWHSSWRSVTHLTLLI